MRCIYEKTVFTAACLISALVMGACGESAQNLVSENPSQDHAQTTVAAENVEEPGNGRSDVKDSLPADLDFGGAEVRLLTRGGDADTEIEFYSEKENGEVVNDAVFIRNSRVEDRLHIKLKLELDRNATRHASISDSISKFVRAGSDEYEVVGSSTYGIMPQTMEGMFLDLNTLDFLDFSQPWWNQAFLEMTDFDGHNYAVIGELSQTMISGTFCMFFNKDMFREFYPDDPSLYETVESGTWTLEKMISYCTPLYQDINGDGKANEGDRFGHYFTNTQTLEADAFVGGCGVGLLNKNEAGEAVYSGISERTVKFTELMNELLFQNNNTCRLPNNNETIMDTMVNEQTLFTSWMLTGVNYLRDMKADYGIIPMPKLDESQPSYMAYVHDGSTAFGVPTTAQKTDLAACFLEAMSAETYRVVTPAYFETALKGKYSRDEETSRMLDLIVSGVYLDPSYVYGQSLGAPISKMRDILASAKACEKAVSTLTKYEKSILKSWDKIISAYETIGNQ
ncbi:MAG: hypothetical protein MJ175_04895 [Clostridia bacterium]|nr:hypothetical protein [Clostridia bacterium]